VKALVQWEDSLIKPRQSQNRISGFSTDNRISGFSTDSVLKPLILFCDLPSRRFNLLFTEGSGGLGVNAIFMK
jgi:hypothetical protein